MIGYIAYPKLGHPSPYSEPMPLTGKQIPKRYQVLGLDSPKPSVGGETLNEVNKNPEVGLSGPKQRFASWIESKSPNFVANNAHEAQHSIFSKIAAQHGLDFQHKLIEHTYSVLQPWERNVIKHISIYPDAPEHQAEEGIAYLHNYLTDKGYRQKVHTKRKLSPKATENLQAAAKHVFKKMQAHASTLDFPTVSKKEVPVFPQLGMPDKRKQVDYISDPKQLNTRLQTMAHAGAQKYYKDATFSGADAEDNKKFHLTQAKREANRALYGAKHSTTSTVGAVGANNQGYALSGILRPSGWGKMGEDNENQSRGTKVHEDFHVQLGRVEQKFGDEARRNLAENLFNSLPSEHRHALNYLQDRYTGGSYNGSKYATEEKIARIFNHLNSSESRDYFEKLHEPQSGYVDNGGRVLNRPKGQYYIRGINRLVTSQKFDNIIKDAHRSLLAAGETANENWLRPGHVSNSIVHSHGSSHPLKSALGKNEMSAHSDTIDHMLGYTHSLYMLCEAARFLTGKPTNDKAFRDALRENDGDIAYAALIAHGLVPTKENLKAIRSVAKIKDLHKSLSETKYNVVACHPEGEAVAKVIQTAINDGHVQNIKLGGKHSHGSLLVAAKDENWLLKPGDGKNSPAAGVAQETATQSQREVAFYKCAEAIGLGHIVPRAELIYVNQKESAAIHMLPFSWQNLENLRVEEPNIGRHTLEPYRASGELFKWAVMDYILGNPDSHGMNIMVSDKDDGRKVALIDHGSAFAGTEFNPGVDSDSWVPYYLRVWTTRPWKELTFEERILALPRCPAEKERDLFHWVLGINPDRLAAIMQRYGVHAQPSIDRLNQLKACKERMDVFIGKRWVF